MGAPKGSKNALGNKGGGRKSMYEERQDALWHEDIWKHEQDIDALIDKVRSRKYAGRDIAALKLLQGNERLIAKFMDKLVPTKLDVTSGGKPIPILGAITDDFDAVQEDNGS